MILEAESGVTTRTGGAGMLSLKMGKEEGIKETIWGGDKGQAWMNGKTQAQHKLELSAFVNE